MLMRSRSPYGNIEFAPLSEVPVGKEWAHDPSMPTNGEPIIICRGTPYDEFPLWLNSWMEDDSRWDDEVHAVHELLKAAAPLNDDFRIMRLQIASYEACHYSFPDSLMKLLACIGAEVADRELITGCDAHYGPRCDDDARRQRVRAYASILGDWAERTSFSDCLSRHLDHEADVRHVRQMLGPWTRLKALYARRLALLIHLIEKEERGYDSYSNHHCYPAAAEIDREIFLAEGIPGESIPDPLDEQAFKELLGRANPLLANISSYYAVICRLHLFRHFDIWISSVGCGEWRRAMPPTGENQKDVERTVANLASALNGWMAGLEPEASVRAWPDALETSREVRSLLGSSTPQKRYLVAMLWKRLKHQKGHAAIDSNPQLFRAKWMTPN